MNKKILILFLMIASLGLVTGCVLFEESLTVEYESGDKLTVSIPREKNLDIELTEDGRAIEIKDDDVVKTSISANVKGNYDVYVNLYDNTSVCTNLENGDKDNLTYKSYECNSVNKKTYIYIVKVNDTNLSLLLTNTESKESSKDIFTSLSFEVK